MPERYTKSVEDDMWGIVHTFLAKDGVTPVLALASLDGVVFMTASSIPGFEKITQLHRCGIYLAGVGEPTIISRMHTRLVHRAHALEYEGGLGNVSLARIRVKEQEADGVLSELRSTFHHPEVVPPRVAFLLVQVGADASSTVFRHIVADGTYGAGEGCDVIWDSQKSDEGGLQSDERLAKKLADVCSATTPTTVTAIDALRTIWFAEERLQEIQPTIWLVRYGNPGTLATIEGGTNA